MKPTAILTADIHLRTDRPSKRIDDFFIAQERKIKFIRCLQEKYNVPIFDGGDLFHRWNSTPYLEAWALQNLPDKCTLSMDEVFCSIYTVAGNHELLEHNSANLEKSSLYVLYKAHKIEVLQENEMVVEKLSGTHIYGFPWKSELKKARFTTGGRNVALIHHMIVDEDLSYKDETALKAHSLFNKMEGFDLIVCGHNHIPFVVKQAGRLIVSPGSMMRTTKAQIEYQPRVYLWYAESNEVEPVFLPIEENVFAVKQMKREEETEKRMEAYIIALKEEYELTLSFKKNMENFLMKNKTVKSVEEIIWKCLL